MKIDPRIQFPDNERPAAVKNSRSKAANSPGGSNASGVSPANGEDTVSFSSAHSDIKTLTASLANVPEVRVDRVSALQQRVQSGHYKPDSQKLADAVLADQAARSKKS